MKLFQQNLCYTYIMKGKNGEDHCKTFQLGLDKHCFNWPSCWPDWSAAGFGCKVRTLKIEFNFYSVGEMNPCWLEIYQSTKIEQFNCCKLFFYTKEVFRMSHNYSFVRASSKLLYIICNIYCYKEICNWLVLFKISIQKISFVHYETTYSLLPDILPNVPLIT